MKKRINIPDSFKIEVLKKIEAGEKIDYKNLRHEGKLITIHQVRRWKAALAARAPNATGPMLKDLATILSGGMGKTAANAEQLEILRLKAQLCDFMLENKRLKERFYPARPKTQQQLLA